MSQTVTTAEYETVIDQSGMVDATRATEFAWVEMALDFAALEAQA